MVYNPKECGERKKVCPFFLLENSRPLSPRGSLDSLSTCLGNDSLSVQFFVILWTVDHKGPLSMGFSRQEYWSGFPCPPGDLPDTGIELASPMAPAGALYHCFTGEAQRYDIWPRNNVKLVKQHNTSSVAIWRMRGVCVCVCLCVCVYVCCWGGS